MSDPEIKAQVNQLEEAADKNKNQIIDETRIRVFRAEPLGHNTDRDLDKLLAFGYKHSQEFAEAAKKGHKALADFIYDKFYSEDFDNRTYSDNADFSNLKRSYDSKAKELLDNFLVLSEKYIKNPQLYPIRPVEPSPSMIEKGWVYFKFNGGRNRETALGRFYLNIKPENLVEFYKEAVVALQKKGLSFDAKIAKEGSLDDFNRNDKMVIYFNEKDETIMLRELEELYKKHKPAFLSEKPRLSAQIVDPHGLPMDGVSFGEEPTNQGGASFGAIRADILASVYEDAASKRYAFDSPEMIEAFRKKCSDKGVDATNTGFNAKQGTFPLIRRHVNN